MLDEIKTKQTLKGMRAGHWEGSLGLSIEHRPMGSRLVSCHRHGPLHVQKAFYPEGKDLAHLYILHPPGGLVSGDDLSISVNVKSNSRSLVTTPGAGRFYGAREQDFEQIQRHYLHVESNASLEWFPMETLFYSGCNSVNKTLVNIDAGGRFIGWDIASLGLPASQQHFDIGKLRQRFEIHYDGQLSWLERFDFNADDRAFLLGKAALQDQANNGFFVAGPFNEKPALVMESLHQLCDEVKIQKQGIAGASFVSKWVVIRYLGTSATHARALFTKGWERVRPELLNRPACAPRIWAC